MKVLGLDIGTTTISAVVADDGRVLSSITLLNDSFIQSPNQWERIQDPACIRRNALQAVEQMLQLHPDINRIGVTGQMHGIVYLDAQGNPVSPLYTWQDDRGDLLLRDGETYAQYLGRQTGYPLSTGYGLVTHFYNLNNHLVPETAVVFCTIHDYIAMLLAGNVSPVIETSDAASLGLFDVIRKEFDTAVMERLGVNTGMLPVLVQGGCIGLYRGRIPVYPAIGDNQASFMGATGGDLMCMLVNVGTGSQFSVYTKEYVECPALETRPFPGGGYLLVGASLCGGRAYALLEQFFRETVEMFTGEAPKSCYEAMNKLMENADKPLNLPLVTPLFQGTRLDPNLRGSITNLTAANFTPTHFVWGMLEGMVQELYEMYLAYGRNRRDLRLIGSGNGLRRNVHLQRCIQERFDMQLEVSECNEEAAAGAALYAAVQ